MIKIDYITTLGKSINESSLGTVVKQIMSIQELHKVPQRYYTYNSTAKSTADVNLFNNSSKRYQYFEFLLRKLPYSWKKKLFGTLNYQMIAFICLYILKKIVRNNNELIIVFNGQPIILHWVKKLLRPKKLIFICHGGSLKVYNKALGEKEVLDYADIIVALNKKVSLELQDKHPKVVLIPNCVSQCSETSFEKDPHKFLYVGRLVGNKRIKELCRRFESCFKDTPFTLEVCGEGYGSYCNETLAFIKNCSQVKYMGYLNTFDLETLYAQSKYIVLISIQEGSPLCLIDSYPFQVKPIGNTVSGTQDFIEAFGGFLLPEDNLMISLESLFLAIKTKKELPFLRPQNLKNQEVFSKSYFESKYREILLE